MQKIQAPFPGFLDGGTENPKSMHCIDEDEVVHLEGSSPRQS